MSKVRMIALDACNGHGPGDDFEVSERESRQLIERGLAKLATPVQNKMAPAPANKSNPTQAAGTVPRSSASPAAQASVQTTAQRSTSGRRRAPTPSSGGSSQ